MDYALQGGGNAKRNPGDSTPLYEVVSAIGFTTVQGAGGANCVGMSQAITDGAAVWVHSREESASGSGGSGLKVSTQFLYVDSSVLAGYQGASAMVASANSYGGINASAVYLNPRSSGAGSGALTVVEPSGSGSGSETPGGGSSEGGGSSAVTVAAPTISGSTTFTDSTQVTISGPAGASIYYTVDGSAPTDQSTEYESALTLSATTTVKAIAVKDGVASAVASKTFTKSEGGDDEPGGDDH